MNRRSVWPPSTSASSTSTSGSLAASRASISVGWCSLKSPLGNKKSGRAPTSGPATGPKPVRKLYTEDSTAYRANPPLSAGREPPPRAPDGTVAPRSGECRRGPRSDSAGAESPRLTYADVVSSLALFVALGGTLVGRRRATASARASSSVMPSRRRRSRTDSRDGRRPCGTRHGRARTARSPCGPAGAAGSCRSDRATRSRTRAPRRGTRSALTPGWLRRTAAGRQDPSYPSQDQLGTRASTRAHRSVRLSPATRRRGSDLLAGEPTDRLGTSCSPSRTAPAGICESTARRTVECPHWSAVGGPAVSLSGIEFSTD